MKSLKERFFLTTLLGFLFFSPSSVSAQNGPYAEELWSFFIKRIPTGPGVTPIFDPFLPCANFHVQPTLGDLNSGGTAETAFLMCGWVVVINDTDNDKYAEVLWQKYVELTGSGNIPLAAEITDMNNDGVANEIVCPISTDQQPWSSEGFTVFQPWDEAGKLRADNDVLWTFTNVPFDRFAIGDLNNDKYPDVVTVNTIWDAVTKMATNVVTAVGGLEQGTIWTYATSPSKDSNFFVPPTLYDVDQNGSLETVISYGNTIEVLKLGDNAPYLQWKGTPGTSLREAVAVADIDGDASPEFLFRTSPNASPSTLHTVIYALKIQNNQLVELWHYQDEDKSDNYTALAVGDIDSDRKTKEVVVSSNKKIYILNSKGELSWQAQHPGDPDSNPALSDLDNDNKLEFAINSEYEPDKLKIFKPTLSATPSATSEPIYTFTSPNSRPTFSNSSPVIGDTNGDGTLEVISVDQESIQNDKNETIAMGAIRAIKTLRSKVNPGEVTWGTYDANLAKTCTIERKNIPVFQRGDADIDGNLNMTDAIVLISYLSQGGAEPQCLDAADSNDSGALDMEDVMILLGWLFLGGNNLPMPYPGCGADPTPDLLDCKIHKCQ